MSTLADAFPEYDELEREELRAQARWARRNGRQHEEPDPPYNLPAKQTTWDEINRRNGIIKGAV